MAGLSNIFGGDDSDSSSSNDTNADTGLVGDLTSTVGLDANSSQTNNSVDEDGSSESSTNDNSLSFDTNTDGLLGAVNDITSSSDESSN